MGIIAVSLAAILIREAQNARIPSLAIAAGRLTIAATLLTPFMLARHRDEIVRLTRRELLFTALSGIFLAIHFAAWITSLEKTTVLVSVVLVSTNPLWIAVLEVLFLRARLGLWVLIGLGIGVIGSIIVVLPQNSMVTAGTEPILGSALAIVGAIAVAIYYVIGRGLRARLSLIPYIWLVYSCAALLLLIFVLITRVPVTGHPTSGYIALLAMALIPQLLGHSSFNFALKYFPATYIGISAQLEPVASALIAFLYFNETPTVVQVLGSVIIIAGVILASLSRTNSS
jgi:drug/metabolite transporter (DMT)-like permease